MGYAKLQRTHLEIVLHGAHISTLSSVQMKEIRNCAGDVAMLAHWG
jgi:hypothetical protein